MFRKQTLFSFTLLLALFSCKEDTLPKPVGELRLDYPKPNYVEFDPKDCPFEFEYSDFAKITDAEKKKCWYYINYPTMKGKIFFTYYPINGDFKEHVKEAEKIVYEHTVKASAIDTKAFDYKDKKVYGNFYELKGQTASNLQFYITDSTRHFVSGYLYFNSKPNPDSLAPAVDYVKQDVLHMIDTFQWK